MPNQSAQPIAFGKYTLLERISHGGMAEVFRAKTLGEAGFERTVAIKLLLPQVAMDDEFVTMLIDEAKIAGQLSHANIAQIFDLGRCDDRYYIVQEYVPGRDLRAILRHLSDVGGRLTLAQSCHILLKVCEGLDYAHNKRDAAGNPLNLVHRDISPQNVIASYEGEIKLIDFGIVKAEGRATRTLAGLVKGKFAYMSPEQLRGLPVDRRSDVFACGIVLHELLTGQPLFKRATEFETLRRARYAEIEPPSRVNQAVPPELDRVALKALARHVDDRYQTALEFRDDLWEFVRSHGCFYSRNELSTWMRHTFPEGGDASADMPEVQVERSEGDDGDTAPPAGIKRLADLRPQPLPPPTLDYDDSDPDSELPQDPDGYADMMTLVEPGYQDRFAADGGPPPEGELADPARSTKPMGSAVPAVRDLADAALSQPDRAVFIPGSEQARLAVGSGSLDLGVKLPPHGPAEEEETTSERRDTGQQAPASAEPPPPAPRDGFGGETDPLGNARWVDPQTPTRQRPRAIDPSEGPNDPEAAATSPYLPAVRKPPPGSAPAMQSSTSGDAVKDALAHAQTLGPNSPRLPGMPPVRSSAEQGPPPEQEPVTWRPVGAPATPSGPAAQDALPGRAASLSPSPMSGPSMSPPHGRPPPLMGGPSSSPMGGGPSMSPMPGPMGGPSTPMPGGPMGGPSMSPMPGGPMGGPSTPMPGGPMGGPSMSPMPGPPMSPGGRAMSPVPATPLPGPGHHASPLPGPYPPHPGLAARGSSRTRAFLFGGAVLVLVAAVIASIVLAASGG